MIHKRDNKVVGQRFRFRLYADGTIVDQKNNNRIMGYIHGPELDEIFMLRPLTAQQDMIRTYLREEYNILG